MVSSTDLDDDELFLQNGWPVKGIYILFPAGTSFSTLQIVDTLQAGFKPAQN